MKSMPKGRINDQKFRQKACILILKINWSDFNFEKRKLGDFNFKERLPEEI